MAIIDWPTDRAFQGAQFSLGLDVSESTSTGFLTRTAHGVATWWTV